MSDDKVNMSLDDIIRLNKVKQNKNNNGRPKTGTGKAGRKAAVRGGRAGASVRGRVVTPRGRGGARGGRIAGRGIPRQTTTQAGNAVNVRKIVQKLVKRAISTQLPAAASRVVAAGRQGVASPRVQLNRINNRSRLIARSAARVAPARARIIQRARGFPRRAIRQVAQPVEIVEEVPVTRVARRPIEFTPSNRRGRIPFQVQRQRRQQAVVTRTVPAIARRTFVRSRPAPQPRQQVVYVQEQVRPIRQRVIQRGRPQVFQQQVSRQPQFVRAQNQKNQNFAMALGINRQRRGPRVQQQQNVGRFEPVFVTRQVVRRGRGFQN